MKSLLLLCLIFSFENQKIILPAGTAVQLLLHPEKLPPVGQTIELDVLNAVAVNDTIVIEKGAKASGRVLKIEPADENACSVFTLSLETVDAVDGRAVPLQNLLCLVVWCGGQEAVLKGVRVAARVGRNTTVLAGR